MFLYLFKSSNVLNRQSFIKCLLGVIVCTTAAISAGYDLLWHHHVNESLLVYLKKQINYFHKKLVMHLKQVANA